MTISTEQIIDIAKWSFGIIGSIMTVGLIPYIKYRVDKNKEYKSKKEESELKITHFMESVISSHEEVKMMMIKNDDKLNKISTKVTETAMMLSATIETSPHAYFICDSLGLCIMANDASLRLFKAQLSEMLGYGWLSFLHPEHRERVKKNWEDGVSSKTTKLSDHYPIIDKSLYDLKGEIKIEMYAAYKALFQYHENELERAVATVWSIEEDKESEMKRNRAFDCIIKEFEGIKKTSTWSKIREEIKQQ